MIFVIYRPINEISVVEQNGIYGQQRLETPDYTPAAHQQFICSDILPPGKITTNIQFF